MVRLFFVFSLLVVMGTGCAAQDPAALTSTQSSGDTTKTDATPSEDKTTMEEQTWAFPGVLPAERIANKQARISTEKGDIVIELYADTAPMAVSNFVYLAEGGYYDGVIFHRVIEGFMIQGGDPTGTGRGGPGYQFKDELSDDRTYTRGTVAMANAGANTNGSQFFIVHKDSPLPHDYTIFGNVVSGMDVVDAIAATPTDRTDRPLESIVMEKVTVEDLAQ